jgi:signal transduction histidine kinase
MGEPLRQFLPSTSRAGLSPTLAKDHVLAVAAHELRHPLHLMRMALARHVADNEPARQSLDRYIVRMVRLIDDVVDYVRSEQGALELQRRPLDLHELLFEILEDYRSTFDDRRVRLSVLAPIGIRVNADPQRLIQVFSNLLDNALKFTPSGGAVVIEAAQQGTQVRIVVRDNGRGVAGSALPRALDTRTDLSRATGSGIGLLVARGVVELHGGSLAVHSDGPDRGTEAVVTLPTMATL